MNDNNLTIRVSWWMQIIQLVFALPCTALAIFMLVSIFQGSTNLAIAFVIFSVLAYFGWANALSTIKINDQAVTVSVFYGRFRIAWDEVRTIALKSPFIALIGNEKRVVLSLAFAGKNKERMLEILNEQAQQRNVKFESESTSFPLTHQNARVLW